MSQILIIEESKWIHGNPDASTLLDHNGCKCCLGFYAKSLGAKDEDILCIGTPAATFGKNVAWHPKLIDDEHFNSRLGRELVRVNDAPETKEDLYKFGMHCNYSELIPLDVKKQRLTEMFA